MDIQQYLESNVLVGDGAFGTYYAEDEGRLADIPEKANEEDFARVKAIHQAYIEAGAKLIRTNTFAANTDMLECDLPALQRNLQLGMQAAKEAVADSGEEVIIAGDIGPIRDGERSISGIQEEYLYIAETLMEAEADILIFETFAELEILIPVIQKIKEKRNVFIITQFCVNQYGYTDKGVSIKKLLEVGGVIDEIDGIGFNCGIGPGHLYNLLKKQNLAIGKYITSFPNASHPQMIHNRLVFLDNGKYFCDKQNDIRELGINIIGGCCGTNPGYIRRLSELAADGKPRPKWIFPRQEMIIEPKIAAEKKAGWLHKEGKIIAVELDPPVTARDDKIIEAANYLKNAGVDILTFADSPNGKRRADSILMSVKVANQVDISVMPHICCRDKNAIAMSSQILGAYMNGIRNMLIITGDPVPSSSRKEIKSVFNFDSVKLMGLLQKMNEEYFAEEPIQFGGAVNYANRNSAVECGRMDKKEGQGCEYFLTQPVFADEDIEKLRAMKTGRKGKMLVGIMPLISYRNALFIQNEIAGIRIPDEVLRRFSEGMTRAEGEFVGVSMAQEIVQKTEDFADGYYFIFPFNRVYLLKRILQG